MSENLREKSSHSYFESPKRSYSLFLRLSKKVAMTGTEIHQIAFLLEPQLLQTGKPAVHILNITKSGKKREVQTQPLTMAAINEITDYQPELLHLLHQFSVESLAIQVGKLTRVNRLAKFENGSMVSEELIRFWHRVFQNIKPELPLMKWYHKKEQPGKNAMLLAPCRHRSHKPKISFDVVNREDGLALQTNVMVDNEIHPIENFCRHQFFLEKDHQFFQLDFADYRTLELLAKMHTSGFGDDASGFAARVLNKIDKRYVVNRNDLIPVIEITSPPVCRVLLTELNNTFLMLTPQWIYDGIVVDNSMHSETEILRNGMVCQIRRNKEAEHEFIRTLAGLHKNFNNQRNGYFYLSFADAIKGQWFFKTYQKLLNQDIEIAGMDMLAHFRYSPHAPETAVTIQEEQGEKLTAKMTVSFGGEPVPLHQLQKVLLAGQKAVILKDGSLGILNESWIKQYGTFVLHGKVKENEIHTVRWMAIPAKADNATLSKAVKEEWWERWQSWQKGHENIFPLPPQLDASLRPYQRTGYEWFALLQEIGAGACLADDMGLGKSVQTIAAIARHITEHPQHKNLVICPASLIYTWKSEFEKFAPSIQAAVYHGQDRQQELFGDEHTQVIITTYSTLRNDVEFIATHFFGVAVLDESHNIKNPGTLISQAVMHLRARFRIALSGTPVINNTLDLYAQLQFAVPGLFGSREFFKSHYANPIDNMQDQEKIAALQKLTAPFILRRTKEQVAKDLPPKTESILWCNMDVDQRSVYEEILESTRSSIFLEIKNKGLAKSKFSILQSMTRLRQVCSSPALVQLEDVPGSYESVKLKKLMYELDNVLDKHKVIVFSQFTGMLHLIADECRRRNMRYYHFDGQTPPAKRAEMVDAFQEEGNDVHLFLISLKAGNTGLTLTAADYVFLFDPWWNSAVENQAIDRTHRIGQTRNVFAYKLICKDTIEEKILILQQKKKKLSEDLVSSDNSFMSSLSEEDIAFLFA